MHRCFFRFTHLFISLLIVTPIMAAASDIPVYWESEITRALDKRDAVADRLGSWDAVGSHCLADISGSTLDSTLSQEQGDESVWFSFARGMAAQRRGDSQSHEFFRQALILAENDPGTLWVLFVEYRHGGQYKWMNSCLRLLELQMLKSGAQKVPAVAQQLFAYAQAEERSHHPELALYYCTAALRFDKTFPAALLTKSWLTVRAQPAALWSVIEGMVATWQSTWQLQSAVMQRILDLVLLVSFLWTIGLFTGLGIRYIPLAIHSLADRLMPSVGQRIKIACATVFIFSLGALGLIPLFWLLAVLVWRHARRAERLAIWLALIMVTMLPLVVWLEQGLKTVQDSRAPLGLFVRTVDEGYNSTLDSLVQQAYNRQSGDYLLALSMAWQAVKRADFEQALTYGNLAAGYKPEDPAVMIALGDICFYRGSYALADSFYSGCLSRYPGSAIALYNLGQYKIRMMETAKGSALMARAAKLDRLLVNEFIEKNDAFFAAELPVLRQVLPPHYQAGYFWSRLFKQQLGSLSTIDSVWGRRMFGLNSTASLVVGALLLVLLLLYSSVPGAPRQVKRLFRCVTCGAVVCPHCRKGIVCPECYEKMREIRSDAVRSRVEAEIARQTRRLNDLVRVCTDIVFPGVGTIAHADTPKSGYGIWLVALSAIVYGLAVVLLGWVVAEKNSSIPSWFGVFLLYPAFFVVRAMVTVFRSWSHR